MRHDDTAMSEDEITPSLVETNNDDDALLNVARYRDEIRSCENNGWDEDEALWLSLFAIVTSTPCSCAWY